MKKKYMDRVIVIGGFLSLMLLNVALLAGETAR
jgi:hypothetical protein